MKGSLKKGEGGDGEKGKIDNSFHIFKEGGPSAKLIYKWPSTNKSYTNKQ